ncbi:TPA: restriction endonuclease subunit S [Proteus mirabilis]|nr:restriction endonuclease subunit S [Proteus mirabilis]
MGNKVKLGELLSILTDYHANGAYKKLKENVELLDEPDFAVMIRTTNFEQEDFTNNLKYINKHAYSFLAKSKVYPNDIIMNKIANAGSSYLMPDLKVPVSLAMNLFLLRVDAAKANPIYIYLYLRVNEAYVKSFANGSVTKTITKDAVRNLEIELPSRSIQDRIAEQFICINNKITLNRQINQTLEQMAQTLFKSWFVDFDPVVDNALDAGFFEQDLAFSDELLRRVEVRKAVRESDNFKPLSENIRRLFPNAFEECVESALGLGGWIPKGWVYKAAENIANVSIGKTPPRKESEWFSEQKESNITWVSIRDMGEFGTYTGSSREYLTANAVKKFNIKLVPKGSILLSFKLTLGRVAIASEELTTNEAIAHFVEPKHDISASYLYCYLTSFDFNSLGSTSSIATAVNSKIIKNMPILVPTKSILNCFKTKVEPLFRKMKLIDDEIVTLTKLRDTLLPKLISGELSLSDIKTDITEEILI